MNLFVGSEQRCRCREWTCGPRVGRGGGNKLRELTETHSVLVKQTANGELLYSAGSPARCSVMTWRGGWERGSAGRGCMCIHG